MHSAKVVMMLTVLIIAALVFPSLSAAEYVETKDGAKIYYQDQGKGQTILLVHGWTCHLNSGRRTFLSFPKSSGWLRSICAVTGTLPRR